MRYNTMNPVGPDGSSSPFDLHDNSGAIDLLLSGPFGEYLNRLGVPLKSWRGIMQQVTDYLIAQGYESTYLDYGAGVLVERQTQLVQRNGELYRVMNASDIPLTLTGTWATDSPKLQAVGDVYLRQQLANPAVGPGIIAFDGAVNYPTGSLGAAIRGIRSIRSFGPIADNGTANDLATFQVAAAAGPGIIDARGLQNCKLDGTITCGAGQTWLLQGSNFVTSNNANNSVFLISQVPNVSIIGPYKATGLGGASANGASFIRINDAIDWLIDSPRIYDMPGYGIYITPGAGTSDRAKHGEIRNPIIRGCNIGILDTAGTGAEYYTIVNPMITFCLNTGLATSAGNVIVLGGHIVDNFDGVFMSGPGNNHSHGMFVGVNINHNTNFNIKADHVTNGETFIGCHMYGGSAGSTGEIFLDNCRGIRFHGGHLACRVYSYETDASAGVNWIEDMFCLGTYGEVQLLDDAGARPKNLIVRNCYGPGSTVRGISINDPSPLYVHARREAATTQALSGATVLLFPVEQANGDRRRAHNPATGVTTIPAIMEGGQYRITANLYFTAASGMTAGSYVQVRINGVAKRLFALNAFSATIGTVVVGFDIFLNPGDTVDLQASITGTTVVFGGPTWESAFSIERIA